MKILLISLCKVAYRNKLWMLVRFQERGTTMKAIFSYIYQQINKLPEDKLL